MDHTVPGVTSATMPTWADPDSPDYDPLLSMNWPPADPPPHAGAERKAWDDALRLLSAAATALLAARPAYVTTATLASRLGVSISTVRRWVRRGQLAAVKRGNTTQARLHIPVSEVDRLTAGRPLVHDPLSPNSLRGAP